MNARTVGRLSFLLFALIAGALAACCSSPPGPAHTASPQTPSQSPAVSAETSLAGTTPAPGSERFDRDPHPENAHLTQVTADSLAQSITDYVQVESARDGGVFPVNDPRQKKMLELTLTTVHRERVSQLSDGRYFACADFKGTDGHTYDVDIFMRKDSTGLTPTELIVHKQDGTPRFDWVERNGTWSQVPIPPQ